jgi:hypothetical protein
MARRFTVCSSPVLPTSGLRANGGPEVRYDGIVNLDGHQGTNEVFNVGQTRSFLAPRCTRLRRPVLKPVSELAASFQRRLARQLSPRFLSTKSQRLREARSPALPANAETQAPHSACRGRTRTPHQRTSSQGPLRRFGGWARTRLTSQIFARRFVEDTPISARVCDSSSPTTVFGLPALVPDQRAVTEDPHRVCLPTF